MFIRSQIFRLLALLHSLENRLKELMLGRDGLTLPRLKCALQLRREFGNFCLYHGQAFLRPFVPGGDLSIIATRVVVGYAVLCDFRKEALLNPLLPTEDLEDF